MDTLHAFRCAKLLIDQHGAGAEDHATTRLLELRGRRDKLGAAAWTKIMAATADLQQLTNGAQERRH